MKVREVIRRLQKHGFKCVRQRGSHRIFRRTIGGRERVTVAGKGRDELPRGTLAAIRRQSGLPRSAFR